MVLGPLPVDRGPTLRRLVLGDRKFMRADRSGKRHDVGVAEAELPRRSTVPRESSSGGRDRRAPGTAVTEFDSHPESRVRNSQPAGIGRVVDLGDVCAWNNLGRNVVFASRAFEPRAVFDQTEFPDDDEPSQYDLDVHAILDVSAAGVVVVLNHLGLLRAFRRTEIHTTGGPRRIAPVWTAGFAGDMERVV